MTVAEVLRTTGPKADKAARAIVTSVADGNFPIVLTEAEHGVDAVIVARGKYGPSVLSSSEYSDGTKEERP